MASSFFNSKNLAAYLQKTDGFARNWPLVHAKLKTVNVLPFIGGWQGASGHDMVPGLPCSRAPSPTCFLSAFCFVHTGALGGPQSAIQRPRGIGAPPPGVGCWVPLRRARSAGRLSSQLFPLLDLGEEVAGVLQHSDAGPGRALRR
jgi:hypothetical protein